MVTRLPRRLADAGGWADHTVTLPDGTWRDELTGRVLGGGEVACAEVLERFPVALLVAR